MSSKLTSSLVGKDVTLCWISIEREQQTRIARLETILRAGRVLTDNEVKHYFGKEANPKNHAKVKHDLYVFNVRLEPLFENGAEDSYNIIWSQQSWEKRCGIVKLYKKSIL